MPTCASSIWKTSVLICTSHDFSPVSVAHIKGQERLIKIHDQVAVDDSPLPRNKEPDVSKAQEKKKKRRKKKEQLSHVILIHILLGDASSPPWET